MMFLIFSYSSLSPRISQAYNPWDGVFGKKSNVASSLTGTKKNSGITKVDTVVIGSGISGATAAFYLHKKGINTLLVEAKDEVGGNLISKKSKHRIIVITKILSFVLLHAINSTAAAALNPLLSNHIAPSTSL